MSRHKFVVIWMLWFLILNLACEKQSPNRDAGVTDQELYDEILTMYYINYFVQTPDEPPADTPPEYRLERKFELQYRNIITKWNQLLAANEGNVSEDVAKKLREIIKTTEAIADEWAPTPKKHGSKRSVESKRKLGNLRGRLTDMLFALPGAVELVEKLDKKRIGK